MSLILLMANTELERKVDLVEKIDDTHTKVLCIGKQGRILEEFYWIYHEILQHAILCHSLRKKHEIRLKIFLHYPLLSQFIFPRWKKTGIFSLNPTRERTFSWMEHLCVLNWIFIIFTPALSGKFSNASAAFVFREGTRRKVYIVLPNILEIFVFQGAIQSFILFFLRCI